MIHLESVLKATGPNAAIIFAAWIFMGFLQQRYDAAVDRYRGAVGDVRSTDHSSERADNLKDQVLRYRRRCQLMARATLVGLISAILLILSLILGAIDAIVPNVSIVAVSGTACLIAGFALVITAACIVIAEGRIVDAQLDEEMRDVPALRGMIDHRSRRS